jgi:ATP-dependent Clp protease ATP-binding subunit ClpA
MYDLLRVGKTFGREDCMFERYTDKARRVISSSIYIARRIGSPEVETEHLLLGLLSKDKGLARRFLGSPWAVEVVWRKIEQSKPIREKTQGPMELPLSNSCRHVLAFAEEIVSEYGIRLASTREDLMRIPHDDSATAKFVREPRNLPEDVVELQIRIAAIVNRLENAIANHDFVKARACSDEGNRERDKLYLLYKQYGLSDWICD